jgi:hypothetical protein
MRLGLIEIAGQSVLVSIAERVERAMAAEDDGDF